MDRLIKDERGKRSYFFQVPNIVFELGLSTHALALYCAVRRTADEGSLCFRSTATLARMCAMSVGSVSKNKRALAAPFPLLAGKPLIRIASRKRPSGGKDYHEITVVDIWPDNSAFCSDAKNKKSGQPQRNGVDAGRFVSCTLAEVGNSSVELASSPGETKKTTPRTLNEEAPPSLSPSSREKESIARNQISELWKFVCTIFDRDSSRGPNRKEQRLMRALIPIEPDEFDLVKWWFGLQACDYHHTQPILFMINRRPMSVRRLLEDWLNVVDVARWFRNEQRRRGF